MSSLYLQLPAPGLTGSTDFAYVLSTDGRTPGVSGAVAAPLLPVAAGAGAEVVAVVPVAMLSWHRFDWPKGVTAGSPRLRAAIGGLLEDELLDDPEAMHFALEPQARAGETAWVAACDRAWLRSALQALDAAGRHVTRIVPEFAPQEPPALHAIGEGETAQLVMHSEDGVLLMPLAPASLDLLPDLADDTLCLAEPAAAAHAEQLLQRTVVLQPVPQRWLQAAQSRWDLAQFEFASSGRARALKKFTSTLGELLHAPRWRPARWGAVLLLAINLVGLNAWAWRERAALADKRESVRATLTQTFPQVQAVIDAPVQMAREVARLRQATGTPSAGDLESLLGALAAGSPDATVSGLDYSPGELRVRGLRWTPEQLRAAEPALRSQGVTARMQGDALVLQAQEIR